MTWTIAGVGFSLLPVVAFLLALIVLDSYKLVRLRNVLLLTVTGMAVAVGCYLTARLVVAYWPGGSRAYARFPSPVIEETAKAIVCAVLVLRNRVGFMVDAAIAGFAVGAGFAVVENVYYLVAVRDASMLTWIVRGFGTAIMHGGVTATFAVLTKALHDRGTSSNMIVVLPGLAVAAVVHTGYNLFLLPPGLNMLAVVLAVPVVLAAVFSRSEHATRSWLGAGFDTDQELLQLVLAGEVSETRVGRYLAELQTRFDPMVVADMLCWIRIQLELSIHAKGLLLMRQAGFDVPPDPSVGAKLDELAYLERTIGPTGILAVAPFVHTSRKDLWQLQLLADAG